MTCDVLAMEHYRFHTIEQWPEGETKDTALESARSVVNGLLRAEPAAGVDWTCIVCGNRTFGAETRTQ